ncbi:unnamed protein product, partial [Allacma fusca]
DSGDTVDVSQVPRKFVLQLSCDEIKNVILREETIIRGRPTRIFRMHDFWTLQMKKTIIDCKQGVLTCI